MTSAAVLPPNVVGYTQADWASQVLQDAGLPQTQNNINNIVRWMVAEEPASNWWDRNNPLNASLGTTSTSGLGSYPDLSTGASFTAKMIRQSNMSGIAQALAANADVNSFSAAVVASPWASGHYGGNPNAIANIPVPTFVVAGGPIGSVAGLTGLGNLNSGGLTPGGFNPSAPAFSLPVLGTVLNQGQELKIKGWFLMIAGGGIAVVGLAMVLATLGLETKAGKALAGAVPGGRAVRAGAGAAASSAPEPPAPSAAFQGGMAEAERRETDERRQAAEAASGPIGPRGGIQGQAARRRRGTSVPGARPHPRPGSRESRDRAEQPF